MLSAALQAAQFRCRSKLPHLVPPQASSRLAYIDWLRGLACVLMFQTHCYDAWLGPAARQSRFFMWSQLGGTFPAPLFLFLAGISFAVVTGKLVQKGLAAGQIAKTTIRRAAEIFALGLLFRIQEFAISLGWAPWSDLFRVDILNTIGMSMMLMGVMCWAVLLFTNVRALSWAAIVVSVLISLVTPLLWTTWRPRFLPWQLESYVNGVHNLGAPQPWLFPIFPWTAFAFAGLAFGFFLITDFAKRAGAVVFVLVAALGGVLIFASKFLDSRGRQIYPVYDYWHTSPNFFMIRVGMLLLLVVFAYGWCRWGAGQWGFSPLIQLGNTSLLVYWVHIEFVYGKYSILPRRAESATGASFGLLIIFVAMLALSLVRTRWKSGAFSVAGKWLGKGQRTADATRAR
jgi:uncharacterized membrane protein